MSAGPPPIQRIPADIDAARSSVAMATGALEKTIARASPFSADELNRRVDDEWSTVESLQHVVFVVDLWLGKVINGADDPFHPMGLPPHFVGRVFPGSSIDANASPTFEEACELMRERLATLRSFVEGVNAEALNREIGTHAKNVAGLGVIFDELTYHDGFINRDLSKIEQARS